MKRRTPPGWWETVRVWVWPRRSWMRSGQYVTKRILRLTATPYAVAAGVAAGAFTSFTPFMGFHFFLAAFLAWIIRGNLIASALGTFVGNPLTFPLIWAATYKVGHFVLQTDFHAEETPSVMSAMSEVIAACWHFDGEGVVSAMGAIWTPILWPMLVGGCLLGPLVAVPLYFLTRRAAALFRESRRTKMMEKAKAIRDRAKQSAEAAGNLGKVKSL
ncbi:MAG: DUF2062 domain-containing protein [Pseudomonadota bacterium]